MEERNITITKSVTTSCGYFTISCNDSYLSKEQESLITALIDRTINEALEIMNS